MISQTDETPAAEVKSNVPLTITQPAEVVIIRRDENQTTETIVEAPPVIITQALIQLDEGTLSPTKSDE